MPFPLFDAPPREPSAFVGFAGNIIDRQSEKRGDDDVSLALDDPATRVIVSGGGRIVLAQEDRGFRPFFKPMHAAALGARLEGAVLLGRDETGPLVAAPADITADLPAGFKAIDHRSVYVQGLIDPDALGALAQGAALLAWHASHRFCGRCGAETTMKAGGYKRACPACKAEHFPRTDPVAIMLAVTPDKCLLGRSPHFAPGMFSALAGFIEPGETIENAVRRETFEESGIRVGRVAYHASQPWPFPYSLMIGCFAEALSEELLPDLSELEACRWFGRDEVKAIIAGTHPDGIVVPPSGAIAAHLIKAWAAD
jgi:NAD+ diphosphatase